MMDINLQIAPLLGRHAKDFGTSLQEYSSEHVGSNRSCQWGELELEESFIFIKELFLCMRID